MKKAVCISCTHHYNQRIRPVEAALQAAGYECTYLTSDFSHGEKSHFTVQLPHCVQLPTRPYRKNISPARILSHMRFARDAMAAVERLQPDLIYVEVPPNALCRAAARYKKTHPQVTLIFDVFDMWPESFPSGRAKKLLALPFRVWAAFRNKGLPKADLVFTECDLFRHLLTPCLNGTPARTLHLCRSAAATAAPKLLANAAMLELCYLGSINNIIDIPTIAALIGHLQAIRPTLLHIIGDGETREALISAVKSTGAGVEYHGIIHDTVAMQAIFDRCSFGLNVMKDSVCVGLTMKSLDYFAGGLPILNTIAGDTWELVGQRNLGINLRREDLAGCAEEIAGLTPETQRQLGENTLTAFHELFTEQVFQENLLSGLSFLMR